MKGKTLQALESVELRLGTIITVEGHEYVVAGWERHVESEGATLKLHASDPTLKLSKEAELRTRRKVLATMPRRVEKCDRALDEKQE